MMVEIESVSSILEACSSYTCLEYSDTTHDTENEFMMTDTGCDME